MENLNGLPIQELNLKGNQISEISCIGLSELPRLSVLDLSENKIKSITPLQFSTNLEQLDLRNNKISMIRQLELLQQLNVLQVLLLHGNPCAEKSFYRYLDTKCNSTILGFASTNFQCMFA
jgi:Leucine-rich repeat (LRR) protein